MSSKKTSKKTCFVVGPIGEEGSPTRCAADWLLKGIIQPVFALSFPEFNVVRSDTITAPGMIDVQMINHLLDAELVIADMSERNPNAFYEMGIRHMAAKPIVHMFCEGTAIPFDVAPYRAIKFAIDEFDQVERAKANLTEVVSDVLADGYVVENPVTRARGVQKLTEQATPAVQMLYEEVADIRRQLTSRSSRRANDGWWTAIVQEEFETVTLMMDCGTKGAAKEVATWVTSIFGENVRATRMTTSGKLELDVEGLSAAGNITNRLQFERGLVVTTKHIKPSAKPTR